MRLSKNSKALGKSTRHESKRLGRLVVALLLLAGWPDWAAAQTATEQLLAESDAAMQAQIGAVFDAKSEIETFQRTQSLKGLAKDKAELVKQLAIFEATSPRKDEFHVLMTLMILGRLDVQPSISFRTLALISILKMSDCVSSPRNGFRAMTGRRTTSLWSSTAPTSGAD